MSCADGRDFQKKHDLQGLRHNLRCKQAFRAGIIGRDEKKEGILMRFWKMNGAGNDFLVLNNLEEKLPEGVNRGQLLAALREAGAVKRDQIAVGGA